MGNYLSQNDGSAYCRSWLEGVLRYLVSNYGTEGGPFGILLAELFRLVKTQGVRTMGRVTQVRVQIQLARQGV